MYWCVSAGQAQAIHNPTPTEKKPANKLTPITAQSVKPTAVLCPGFNAAYASS